MPVHDWTRVSAGTFHDFHSSWITHIKEALNDGVLPDPYYALSEQDAGEMGPDVRTLRGNGAAGAGQAGGSPEVAGVCTLASAPPQVRFTMEPSDPPARRRRVVIRHTSEDRIVAMIEVVSPGNKSGRYALRRFANKALDALHASIHLLLIDLLPPGPRDPQGIHGALWEEVDPSRPYTAPADKPLTLASYAATGRWLAFVEPVAVGDVLLDMPLFIEAEAYVNVPLERTCQQAYRGVPRRWREVIEGSNA